MLVERHYYNHFWFVCNSKIYNCNHFQQLLFMIVYDKMFAWTYNKWSSDVLGRCKNWYAEELIIISCIWHWFKLTHDRVEMGFHFRTIDGITRWFGGMYVMEESIIRIVECNLSGSFWFAVYFVKKLNSIS